MQQTNRTASPIFLRQGERCYAYVKALLLDGGLDPGDSVSVEALSRALNTSRQPVMDAVKRLSTEGFINIIPQVGCKVTTPDPDEVDDFYKMFAAAEALIARLAAERRSDEEARAYMRLAASVAEEATHLGNLKSQDPRYHHLVRRRHGAIHAMAHSPVIAEIAAGMWDRSNFYVRTSIGSAYFTDHVKALHRQIDDAILKSDGAAAESATHKFVDGGRPIIVLALKRKLRKSGD